MHFGHPGSMPFVSRPVIIDGKPYLDGGISDSIPFRFAESLGCEKRIVILTRDMEYRKKPMVACSDSTVVWKEPDG